MLRKTLATFAGVLLLALCGCNQLPGRPCGPGFLGNIPIPQQFAGADFRPACYEHDACYGQPCGSRKECDQAFRQHMFSLCECSRRPCLCRLRAMCWYTEVRLFGGPAYRMSQRDAEHEGCCCDCCPGEDAGQMLEPVQDDAAVPEPMTQGQEQGR